MVVGASPRGPYRTGIKRRKQIVDTALVIFARSGYAGASLRQIADEVGVTVPGLLRHFGSKEELLYAVLEQWGVETDNLSGDGEGLAYFYGLVRNMRYHETHPGLIELYLTLCGEASDPAHPARPYITRRFERITASGVAQLRIARAAGKIRMMSDEEMEREVRGLFGLMDGLELQWITNRDIPLAATFESLLEAIVGRWRGSLPNDPGADTDSDDRPAPNPKVMNLQDRFGNTGR